jgi:transposase
MRRLENTDEFVAGKVVFTGLDVHKKHWVACIMCDGEVLEHLTIAGQYGHLQKLLERYRAAARIHVVYEAGFMGSWLYRRLHSDGYDAMITPSAKIPRDGSRVKTDRIDAEKLCRYLSAGLLKRVYVLPESVENDRFLIRRRRQVVRNQTRIKNQIHSLLFLSGLARPAHITRNWSKAHLLWLEQIPFRHSGQRISLDLLLAEYESVAHQLRLIKRHLQELSKHPAYRDDYRRLTSVRGVGLITAMSFLLEIYDFDRFANEKHFGSYLGLTPSQHSSGSHVRLGHISRQGNSYLRGLLIESAWTVIRYDDHLAAKYQRIKARGTNGKKAIVAVARSLAIRLRRCLLDESDYQLQTG